MKKNLLILIAFLIAISFANSQEKLTENQRAVQNTIIKIFDALSNRDATSLRSHCTTDILIFENGLVWNLDTLIQAINLNQAPDFRRINTIDFIDTKVNKDIAWATYNNQAEVTKNGKHAIIKWMETVILIREGKIWRAKVLHSTLIKRS